MSSPLRFLPNVLSRRCLTPHIAPVRFGSSRREWQKLKKPEDKSTVVLGHIRKSLKIEKEGISNKQTPIMVTWKKPVMVETCNPVISGDVGGLEHFGAVNLSEPPVHLEESKELAQASEDVKKILSLEYRRNRDVITKLKKMVQKEVEQHPLDTTSLEVRITGVTISIRNLQRDLIERYPYKNQPVKHRLTHLISHRRVMLKKLRETDYRKFEWLLEKLNLVYQPFDYNRNEPVARKASIERLTDTWCSELRQHKINKYKDQLENDQPLFLRRKAEKLKFIMEEEADLGIEPTVTQLEIDECLERARRIEEQNVEEEKTEYLVFKEEAPKDAVAYFKNQ